MKRFLFLLALTTGGAAQAQEVKLQEVVVNGARVVQQADRQVVYPTRQQLAASTSGYSLLAKLALPHIRVDETMHTVTALGNTGQAQVRINDQAASRDDLLALDMEAVERIEYIDHPGVRYGEDVAYIINIIVKRPTSGYVLGADLTNTLTTLNGDNDLYAKLNHGLSEWSASYNASYHRFRNAQYDETATYLLSDGSTQRTNRHQLESESQAANHNLQLTYSLSDSTYVLQAKLTAQSYLRPGRHRSLTDVDGSIHENRSTQRQQSPSVDLYWHKDFRRHQSLTANAVGTYIGTHADNEQNEGGAYQYHTDGHARSLWSEAVYENRLDRCTLSAGLQYALRHTDNDYQGDASAHNDMHTTGLYAFTQLKGRLWQRLDYVAGLGASRRHYRQDATHNAFLLLRPKLSLAYPLGRGVRLRYDFEISQHTSQIALISNVSIKQNSMETLVGNLNLRPNRVTSHDLRLSYTTPRLNAELQAYYRLNAHCNMEQISRQADNTFLRTQTNQGCCDFFFVQPYARWDVVPSRLTANVAAGLYRFFNTGADYSHTYTSVNCYASLQAYLGSWTFTAYADNGYRWMECENRGHQGAAVYLTVARQLRRGLTLALYCQYPFTPHPTTMQAQLLNRYIEKHVTMRTPAYGNRLSLNLSWNLSHGRKYRDISRTLNHRDTETGILGQ